MHDSSLATDLSRPRSAMTMTLHDGAIDTYGVISCGPTSAFLDW